MEDYQLEVRPVKELVKALRSMGYEVTEQDLHQPTPYRTQVLFENFIYLFTPEHYEILKKNRSQSIQSTLVLTGPTDVNSVDSNLIYTLFEDFLEQIRFTDFDLTDVISPTARRLVPIINAVVNFAFFSQSLRGTCNNWEKLLEAEDRQIEDAQKYEEDIKNDFDRKVAQKLKEEEEIKELRRENAKIFGDVNKLKEKLDYLQANKALLKVEKESLKDVLQGDHVEVLNINEQLKNYKKIRNVDLDEILTANENLIIYIQDKSQKLHEELNSGDSMKLDLARTEEITNAVTKSTKIMFHIKSMNAEISRQQKLISSMEERFNSIQGQLAEITEIKSRLKMDTANLDIESQQINEQAAKLIETKELFYLMNEQRTRELTLFLKDHEKKELEMQDELKKIERRHNELVQRNRTVMQQISNKITLIQARVEQRFGEIQNMEDPETELVKRMSKNTLL